jgi:tetratricopeptide (TPR) repeat protein
MKARLFIRSLLFLLVIAWPAASFSAGTGNAITDSANAAYARADYEKAAKLYEQVLSSGTEAAEVYYNLGNAYFKLNRLGPAILNYERAKKLSPGDEDINYNLEMANQRIVDKIEPVPQLFIDEWQNSFRNMFSETGWSIVCITTLALMLLMVWLYITGRTKTMRQAGFWSSVLFLVIVITSFVMAGKQKNASLTENDAIITSPAVTAKGSPSDNGTKLFIIHEGTKVHIEDTNGEWVEVKLANGNVGWLPLSSLSFI